MRIAFDLDDTLIPGERTFEVEALGVLGRFVGAERLRAGVPGAMARLRAAGHELWVYTSSLRSSTSIRITFLAHGVWIDGVVNQHLHDTTMRGRPERHSKFPPAFGIDVLFDDSSAVRDHGRAHGFRVVLVHERDDLAAAIDALVTSRSVR
ncbi:MAG: hypothetical protein U0353_31460 [Sandaracinus sp.]